MYLRRCYRKKDDKRHAYWALVESYRTARGPRQRVVAWLGAIDEQGRLGVKRGAEGTATHQGSLFRDTQPEWVEVDVKRVQVERTRKFGGPWLGLELLRRLELDRFLEETLPEGGEEIPWPLMATVLVRGRLLGDSPRTVWVHRFEAHGLAGLREGERSGRPSRLNHPQLKRVRAALWLPPQHCELEGHLWDGRLLSALPEISPADCTRGPSPTNRRWLALSHRGAAGEPRSGSAAPTQTAERRRVWHRGACGTGGFFTGGRPTPNASSWSSCRRTGQSRTRRTGLEV